MQKPEQNERKYAKEKTTKENTTDIKVAFEILEKNRNGCISASDLRCFLTSLGYNMTECEIMDMMNIIDSDGNSAIDFEEFYEMAIKKLHVLSDEEMASQTYKVFDRAKKGHISLSDIRHIFNTLKQSFNEQELQDMLFQADFDHDGKVNLDDFLKMMTTE